MSPEGTIVPGELNSRRPTVQMRPNLYKKQNFCCYITLKWQKIKFEKIIWLLYDLEIAKIEISDKKFCCYMTLGKQKLIF